MAEAASIAIRDSGLRKDEIDCTIAEPNFSGHAGGFNAQFAEYIGIQPTWATGCDMQGATGVVAISQAAAYIQAGLAKHVLVVCGDVGPSGRVADPRPFPDEFIDPYGPVVAANGWYAMFAMRHSHQYGSTTEQRARIAVDQRYNAQQNPNAYFNGNTITVEDVLNSRLICDPLHLLECVMPCSGAVAYIVTSAERARSLRQPPAYILGGGSWTPRSSAIYVGDIATAPVSRASKLAFEMAGYGPQDMDVLEIYDSYTITVMCELEDSGFCPKGEGGAFVESTSLTYDGDLPLNTHGGQMSAGQAGDAGGFSQVAEAVRQLRGQADGRQVKDAHLAYVTGSGGVFTTQSAAVLTNDPTA
jgi:acetyl-CoA acetyltransferase